VDWRLRNDKVMGINCHDTMGGEKYMNSMNGHKSGEVDFFNPILHTVWLDSHALTLKNYTGKYYEVRKIWFFAYLTNFLSSIEENCRHVYIVFLLL
jgi:hypothetical protein